MQNNINLWKTAIRQQGHFYKYSLRANNYTYTL